MCSETGKLWPRCGFEIAVLFPWIEFDLTAKAPPARPHELIGPKLGSDLLAQNEADGTLADHHRGRIGVA